MAIRGLWQSLLPIYLCIVATAVPHSRMARTSNETNAKQAKNAQAATSNTRTAEVVACLTVEPPNLEGGYVSVRDTEQHSDVIADTSELSFTLHTPQGERALLTYGTYDSLVALTASRYSDVIFTGWEGGAHEAMRIFRLRRDGVRLVFEAVSRQMPEVVWDGTGVMVSRGYLMKGNEIWPTNTEIYVWNKDARRYRLVETVPYERRYDALAKLVSEAEQRK